MSGVADSALTLSELQQYLGRAADLLRGSIDQADFKAYIFPLMFFKRISDTYTEEFAQALEESDGDYEYAAFAENHRFAIPEYSAHDFEGFQNPERRFKKNERFFML